MRADALGFQKKASNLLELELYMVMSHLMWGLGIELRPSARETQRARKMAQHLRVLDAFPEGVDPSSTLSTHIGDYLQLYGIRHLLVSMECPTHVSDTHRHTHHGTWRSGDSLQGLVSLLMWAPGIVLRYSDLVASILT